MNPTVTPQRTSTGAIVLISIVAVIQSPFTVAGPFVGMFLSCIAFGLLLARPASTERTILMAASIIAFLSSTGVAIAMLVHWLR